MRLQTTNMLKFKTLKLLSYLFCHNRFYRFVMANKHDNEVSVSVKDIQVTGE